LSGVIICPGLKGQRLEGELHRHQQEHIKLSLDVNNASDAIDSSGKPAHCVGVGRRSWRSIACRWRRKYIICRCGRENRAFRW